MSLTVESGVQSCPAAVNGSEVSFNFNLMLWLMIALANAFSSEIRVPQDAGRTSNQVRLGTHRHTGFTLVEILVVIAIIGMLVAIALPAIQMARESARRSSCGNNLKQLGLAAKLHADLHGHFPTGGWGQQWVGNPNQGFGTKQPGGWIYNVLPFIEQQPLRDLGLGQSGKSLEESLGQLMQNPVEVLNCPSRRSSETYPYKGPTTLSNATPPEMVAKSDYAISSAISYAKSEIIVSEIQLARGMSKTLLIAEKSVPAGDYMTGQAAGDQLSMYAGDSDDVRRGPDGKPSSDNAASGGFGGAHPGGCNSVSCDGSVRFVVVDERFEP